MEPYSHGGIKLNPSHDLLINTSLSVKIKCIVLFVKQLIDLEYQIRIRIYMYLIYFIE